MIPMSRKRMMSISVRLAGKILKDGRTERMAIWAYCLGIARQYFQAAGNKNAATTKHSVKAETDAASAEIIDQTNLGALTA